jgi:hypothetical protein
MEPRRRDVLAGLAGVGATFSQRSEAQTNELVIRITLPTDRTRSGTLSLSRVNGQTLLTDVEALGKADSQRASAAGNPTRDPTRPFGDTPEGTYNVPRVVDTGPGTNYSSSSYGPHAALVLQPSSGQALTAASNGRVGLLIHSGNIGANGRLRATHGCIRLSNDNMGRLLQAIRDAGLNPVFNRCEVVRVSVVVGNPADEGAGTDESDPPPGISDLLLPRPIVIP